MSLTGKAWANMKASNMERVPVAPGIGLFTGGLGIGGAGQINQQQLLRAYADTGWLFAVVSLISEAVASAKWKLYRVLPNGDREEIVEHPALDLWENINPFTSRSEHLEASQQHFELVGEMWWILNFKNNMPSEIQLVRPDRMRPIPHKTNYVQGYIYTLGQDRVILEPSDVIFIKRPSPLDPYRGIGVVQSLMVDLGAERAASLWTRNFFDNSAEPGGIIEFDRSLSDAEFNQLRDRWSEQHRGVANAHRVALLERGKWVDRKLTQRDMQFEQLRKLNREMILDAFRIPRALLGISEAVNRSNAEAGEVHFSRWVLRPRLDRIRSVVNQRLIHPYFGPDLDLDYMDPTPRDRELNLREAVEGKGAGILTQNEARARIGEGEVPGGDEFDKPAASPFLLGAAERRPIAEPRGAVAHTFAALKSLEDAEGRLGSGWTRRLSDEAAALSEHLGAFQRSPLMGWQKIEVTDVDSYDWDWWSKYGSDSIDELIEAFEASLIQAFPEIEMFQMQRLAAAYAEHRGAQLLRLDGNINVVELTRARVRSLVAGTIERGDSLQTLQKTLREDFVFSPARATTVARTETATALGQGAKQAAVLQGQKEKAWITQGDAHVDIVECRANEQQGWISIHALFQSGDETIPAHPNCRCTVLYREGEPASAINPAEALEDDIAEAISGARSEGVASIMGRLMGHTESLALDDGQMDRSRLAGGGRCPTCNKATLVVNRDGPGFWCRRCNKEIT